MVRSSKVLALPLCDQRELRRTVCYRMFGDLRAVLMEASLKIWMNVLLIPQLGAPFIVFPLALHWRNVIKRSLLAFYRYRLMIAVTPLMNACLWSSNNVRIDAPEPLQLLVSLLSSYPTYVPCSCNEVPDQGRVGLWCSSLELLDSLLVIPDLGCVCSSLLLAPFLFFWSDSPHP